MTTNCNHPPKARCINCMNIDAKSGTASAKKDEKEGIAASIEKKEINKCSHGPGGKCINCLGEQVTTSEKKNIGE